MGLEQRYLCVLPVCVTCVYAIHAQIITIINNIRFVKEQKYV